MADASQIPDEILLVRDREKGTPYDRAYTQKSWPSTKSKVPIGSKPGGRGRGKGKPGQGVAIQLTLPAACWEFDGFFQKKSETLTVQHEGEPGQLRSIQDLTVFPIRYAGPEVAEKLRKRGENFWRCRHREFVSYTGWDFSRTDYSKDVRFMIDIAAYRKFHPDAAIFKKRLNDDLGVEAMQAQDPPASQKDFLLLLPPNVYGFNMIEKKWVNLLVDNTSPVVWNTQAFDSLAVDKETKDLIQALVSNKIAADKSTDLMSGKGNGLIVLLHGGPGTGKTLTAESVAEISKKPLYRVTCGDIGTNPEDVEKYLTIVLYLGKIWDAIVLLDEAEVFLQERSLKDLQRNALVSVFLRVLEYYDGILILTSNRVGTFDEAFKSRIQLALHYDTLKPSQRRQIWQNFIERLRKLTSPDEINTEDLEKNLDSLAKEDMNGRQIRNAVTTARQLAMFQGKAMDFEALKHVIGVSSKFDRYLKKVKENMTDEQIARDEGIR